MADILVVEDEQLIARLLKETLQSEGYNVVTVLNGEDAVQFALCETPHLIILDIMLNGIDGYEVVQHLRSYPKTIHIPIIVLSALGEPKDKVRAFESGVDDYVTKPFHTDELLARVHAQLRREGHEVNIKRVERLMRVEKIQGAYVPRKRRRAGEDGVLGVDGVRVWPDLVKRDFQPAGPNELWCSDLERHEALCNRAVMKGHRLRFVAADR